MLMICLHRCHFSKVIGTLRHMQMDSATCETLAQGLIRHEWKKWGGKWTFLLLCLSHTLCQQLHSSSAVLDCHRHGESHSLGRRQWQEHGRPGTAGVLAFLARPLWRWTVKLAQVFVFWSARGRRDLAATPSPLARAPARSTRRRRAAHLATLGFKRFARVEDIKLLPAGSPNCRSPASANT